jgi:NAD(P)-dependent dehydrogenase (short-subunit alcohol dehydrogenase family)
MSSTDKPAVAVVTGAGSGIGAGISRFLAARGYSVALWDLDVHGASSVLAEIEEMGGTGVAVAADVSDPDSVRDALSETRSRSGPPVALVNNAGVRELKPFFELTPEEWQRIIGVDLSGVFYCTRAVAEGMRDNGPGAIVNISSIVAHVGFPDRTAYSSAKAGVLGLTRSTARSLGPYGIRVNAIAPGLIESPMQKQSADRPESAFSTLPISRMGTPIDIAAATAFLLSDEASYITGVVLNIDGGRIACA